MTFTDEDSPSGRRSVFTDLDLKRLKKWIQTDISESRCIEIEALLARLEAAEDVASHVTDCPIIFIERWRKAAGK